MPPSKSKPKAKDIQESHSATAEMAAIANVLSNEECKLIKMLEPDDFFDTTLREIWIVMKKLDANGTSIDFLSVTEELQGNSAFEEHGGSGLLADITARALYTGTDDNIYNIIKRHHANRESVGVYREALGKNIDDVPALLSDQSKRIADMLPKTMETDFDALVEELSGEESRVPTGIGFADECYEGGLAKEALHVFAGRPGTGKSSMMTTFCAEWIRRDVSFSFISLEMSRREVLTRILCAYHGVTAKEVRARYKELAEVFRKANFNITVGTGTLRTVRNILLTAEEDVLIIDHLGLITDPDTVNKVQEVSNVTRMLKLCAMEVQKPVVACHQMSRAIEQGPGNREPRLSDLRDSGSVEQDADNVTFLWNPHAKEDDAARVAAALEGSTTREIRFIVRKQRNGPPDLYKTLDFDMPKFSFTESDHAGIPKMEQVSMEDAAAEVFSEPKDNDLPF